MFDTPPFFISGVSGLFTFPISWHLGKWQLTCLAKGLYTFSRSCSHYTATPLQGTQAFSDVASFATFGESRGREGYPASGKALGLAVSANLSDLRVFQIPRHPGPLIRGRADRGEMGSKEGADL